MNKRVRWGVLSTANIAKESFIPAVLESDYAELLGIASKKVEAKNIASTFNIPVIFSNYEELLQDPNIDAVYIPLPNQLHAEWVIKAAEHKKHVLCEKPATLTVEALEEVLKACRDHQVFFMEAFMYQFHPQHKRVKDIIQLGEIGVIEKVEAIFSYMMDRSVPNIRLVKGLGGGSLFDIGCYAIHIANLLLDRLPVKVEVKAKIDENSGVDVSANGTFFYEDGTHATIHCSFEEPFRHEYTVYGSKGKIMIPRAFRPDIFNHEGIIRIEKDGLPVTEEKHYGHQYKNQVDYFSAAILNKILSSSHLNRTVQNTKVLEACYQSMMEQKIIFLNEGGKPKHDI